MMKRNRRGITLVEVLAVIVILGIVMGGILYLTDQTHATLVQQTTRDEAKRDSRTVLNHMVNALRKENASLSSDGSRILIIHYSDSKEVLTYSFDASLHQVSYALAKPDGTTMNQVLSQKVKSIVIERDASETRKVTIRLTMLLPNQATDEESTVVYVPSL
ncbi:type II secretion system protein [Gorillibacterium timonense]|uniref:type II secretion system protein n=1 Tax=Gorillibacterium timonense TaxID=1689269 RepID=UPI00071E23E5|nr:prepilin-type N-terminal cleavage/methylation domain-containing protein [Gorillibacterium timonense]